MIVENKSKPSKHHISPQTGTAFTVNQGQKVRVIDVCGEQVADLFCFSKEEQEESLSSGHTIDYNGKLYLSKGDKLFSSKSNPMFTITADQVGRHIMLYAPCSQEMFTRSYGIIEAHPNCLDNLAANLKEFEILASQISIPFNIFMNIDINGAGEITIKKPRSEAGQFVELRAEMDLIVGVTACSAGACNNFEWTPIEVEIYN